MLLTFLLSVIVRNGLVIWTDNMAWLRFVVSLSALLNAPVKPLMDSAIMSMLVDKSDYGRSRLFGQVIYHRHHRYYHHHHHYHHHR